MALLNSLFGTQLRLPAARLSASVLPRRALHGSAIRFSTAEEPEGVLLRSVASRTEVVTEVVEEEFSPSVEVATESSAEVVEEEHSEILTESSTEMPEEATPSTPADVPWFLRVETPRPASHPFANLQTLPEIPPDAPPALEPLLKHLSEELGISDIALIDLRALDPPPAIGADTIMVVGNARSERHLHISADKACRWLRSAFGMAPHADGLLGRNEIKIKNRRLKKRGRLVSTQTGQVEGVGWICVDVGSQGLVLQLFTKYRRDEIDLEGLWGKYLGKGATIRKATSIEEMFGEKEPVEDVDVKYTPPIPVVRLGAGLSEGSGFSSTQRRSLHTTPRRSALESLESQPEPGPPPTKNLVDFKGIDAFKCVESGQYWLLTGQLPSAYKPGRRHAGLATLVLKAQINHLKHTYPGTNTTDAILPSRRDGRPCDILGTGPADTSSTEFLRTLHANLAPPRFLAQKFRYHLEFLAEAHRIHPQAYPTSIFLPHLNSALATEITLTPELYYLALHAISDSPTRRRSPLPWTELSTNLINAMTAITDHMKTHCPNPDTTISEIQYLFFRALTPPHLDIVHTVASTICSKHLAAANKPVTHVLQKYPFLHVGGYHLDSRLGTIDAAIKGSGHKYTLREHQEMLLTTYAMGGAWIAFWNRWKSLRYMGVHRDAELYGLVVGLLVMGGNQRECVNAARWLPRDMVREVPGVGLTVGMARGFLRMVEIAEGGGVGTEETRRKGWLGELRVRCEGVIERVGRRKEEEKGSVET